jgi:hypothetical protein
MHKMIQRSSSTNKWLQLGMLLSLHHSFCSYASQKHSAARQSHQDNSGRAHEQLPASGLRARKKLCAQQLKGSNLDDSFGKLQEFADCHLLSTLVLRHNDPEDGCHIDHQNEAAFDVIFVDAHSRLPCHQSRLGFSAQP